MCFDLPCLVFMCFHMFCFSHVWFFMCSDVIFISSVCFEGVAGLAQGVGAAGCMELLIAALGEQSGKQVGGSGGLCDSSHSVAWWPTIKSGRHHRSDPTPWSGMVSG